VPVVSKPQTTQPPPTDDAQPHSLPRLPLDAPSEIVQLGAPDLGRGQEPVQLVVPRPDGVSFRDDRGRGGRRGPATGDGAGVGTRRSGSARARFSRVQVLLRGRFPRPLARFARWWGCEIGRRRGGG